MSIQLIQKYYAEVDKIIRYGGSRNESSLRKPFQDLLEQYARSKNLVLVAEVELTTKDRHADSSRWGVEGCAAAGLGILGNQRMRRMTSKPR